MFYRNIENGRIACKVWNMPSMCKTGVFFRNGSTKTEPPQLIFRCNGCGVSYCASTMRSIVQFFISDFLYLSSTEEIIKTSRHSQEIPNRALNQPQEDISVNYDPTK